VIYNASMHFIWSLVVRAWDSFLSALGTTGLGFGINNIWLAVLTAVATYIVTRLMRGPSEMKAHTKQNLLIGLIVYVVVLPTAYLPVFLPRLISDVPQKINRDADSQPVPCYYVKGRKETIGNVAKIIRGGCFEWFVQPALPAQANELSVPMPNIFLHASDGGFALDLHGSVDLQHKRQYLFTVENSWRASIENLVLELEFFPHIVESRRIVFTQNAHQVSFDPIDEIRISTAAITIEQNGCMASPNYILSVGTLAYKGKIEISLILNDSASLAPPAVMSREFQLSYFNGTFSYTTGIHTGHSDIYIPLKKDENGTVQAGTFERRPATLRRTSGSFTLSNCIPNEWLLKGNQESSIEKGARQPRTLSVP
jgi:hypothetical protein